MIRNFLRTLIGVAFTLALPALGLAQAIPTLEGDASSAPRAQSATAERTMLILDYSNSMWEPFGNGAKMQETRRILRDQLARNEDAFDQTGLMAYGHRSAESCGDIELIYRPGEARVSDILATADRLTPTGQTPLTSAVSMGVATLAQAGTRGSVILLTDGTESCGQNPCSVASEISATGADIRVHVIAIGMSDADAQTLSCLPERTGGLFLTAANASELASAFAATRQVIVEASDQVALEVEVEALNEGATEDNFRIVELEVQVETLRAQLVTAEAIAAARNNETIEDDPDIDNALVSYIAELENLIARLEMENERLAGSAAASAEINVALQQQLQALTAELERARGLSLQLQDALVQSQGETASLADAYEVLLLQLQQINANTSAPANCSVVEDQLVATQGQLNQQTDENADLRAQIANLSDQAEQIQRFSQCEGQIGATLDEMDVITDQLNQLIAERTQLLSDNQILNDQLETELERRINSDAALQFRADSLSQSMKEVQELQDTVGTLNARLARVEEQLRSSNRTIDAQRSEINVLETQLLEAREGRQDEIDALNIRVAELRQELKESEEISLAYTDNLTELERINLSLDQTINQIQIDNAGKDVVAAELGQENADLQGQLNEAQRLNTGYRQRIDQMEAYLASLLSVEDIGAHEDGGVPDNQDQVVAALRQELAAVQNREEELIALLNDAQAQVADLEEQLVIVENACSQVKDNFADTRNHNQDLLSQLTTTQDTLASCQSTTEELTAAVPERVGPDTVRVEMQGVALTELSQPFSWEVSALDQVFNSSGSGEILTLSEIPGRYRVRLLFGDQYVEDVYEVLSDETRHHVLPLSIGSLSIRFENRVPAEFQSQSIQVKIENIQNSESVTQTSFLAGRTLEVPLAPGQYNIHAQAPGLSLRDQTFVVPSQSTEIVLPWETALARIRFTDFQNGEGVQAPVHWRIFKGDELVLTGVGDVQLPLQNGQYRIDANVGGVTAQAEFTLDRATARDVVVPFEKGQIDLGFENAGQKIVDERFHWYLYDLSVQDTENRVVASGSADDTEIVVPAGTYQLEGFFGNDTRTLVVDVPAARQVPGRMTFGSGVAVLNAGLAGADSVQWLLERVSAGTVTQEQSFTTTDDNLTYALQPGYYRVRAQSGDIVKTAQFNLVLGETTTLTLQ